MPPDIESVLSTLPLFDTVRGEERERLVRGFVARRLVPGELAFDVGDAAEALYVVAEGALTLFRRRRDGAPWVLARLRPGDLFGELGLIEDRRRDEAARAEEASWVLALGGEPLQRVIRRFPIVALKLNLLAAQGHQHLADLSLAHAMRAAPRYRVHRDVRLETDAGETVDATLVDLSESGARFLRVPDSWRPGARTRITMTLTERRFEIGGTVAWTQEGSAGLAFEDPQPELLEYIQRTLGAESA